MARQVVQVYVMFNPDEGGVYTYVWKGGEPLAIGDRVRVRDPSLPSDTLEGVVTALDSDYEGYLVIINSKVEV
jgi:hypothetical protein